MNKLLVALFLAFVSGLIVLAVHVIWKDLGPAFRVHADESVSNQNCCIIRDHAAYSPATDPTLS